MSESETILSFENVALAATSRLLADLRDVTFGVAAGQLIVLRTDPQAGRVPLFDLAEGLVEPEAGRVTMDGREWPQMSRWQRVRARAAIGRVFAEGGWISNLTVLENVTLAARHHSRRPEDEIVAEAHALARDLGLNEVPGLRPHLMRTGELRKAQWVRALLGEPRLLLLEEPGHDMPRADVERLAELVGRACSRGAGVVWMSDGWELDGRLPVSAHYVMTGGTVNKAREGEDADG